tara:strand:- start:3 stop:581 length:579 start_codon:yes stop_codon:yes gene_type:complete
MKGKKIIKIFFIILLFFVLILFSYLKIFTTEKPELAKTETSEDIIYKSNIIENVNYTTKDADGNEYIVTALQGEIDYSNSEIIYLTRVKALIKLKDSDIVTIDSDFGKYNTNNFDTIFSKNVVINYLDNNILGEYLDFSLARNSMIISRKVVYTNFENIMKADVIEIDIKTKDTKIFMYENDKKVNIKNKNY